MRTRVLSLASVFVVAAASISSAACAPRGERVVRPRLEAARSDSRASTVGNLLAIESDFAALRTEGEALFYGRGGCHTCHRVDDRGTRYTGPNLGIDPLCATDAAPLTARDPVACLPLRDRAAARHAGRTPIEYALESILDPDLIITPTYAKSVMKRQDLPPLSLTDREILSLATFVVSLHFHPETPPIAQSQAELRAFMRAATEARDQRLAAPEPR